MKNAIILAVLFAFACNTNAQERNELRQRLESQKVAFITTELDLTAEEAQRFWPIYNDYTSKLEIFKTQQKELKNSNAIENLSEAEAATLVESILSQDEEEIALRRAYATKLKSAVSSKKIAQLFILEKQFKDRLMNKIRRKMRRHDKADSKDR